MEVTTDAVQAFFENKCDHIAGLPEKELLLNPLIDIPKHLKEDAEIIEFYKMCNEYYSPEFGIKYLLKVDLFPYQMSAIRAMMLHKFPLLLLSRGSGKTMMLAIYAAYHALMNPNARIILISAGFRQCVTGDTYVNANGGLIKVKDLNGKPKNIVSSAGIQSCSNFWKNNKQETIKIESEMGFSIEGSKKHKVLVSEEFGLEYKELEDINVGDYVALSISKLWNNELVDITEHIPDKNKFKGHNTHNINLPNNMDEDLAYFIGVMIGDGCFTQKNYLIFTNTDQELLSYCSNRFSEYFEKSGHSVTKEDGVTQLTKGSVLGYEFFNNIGLAGKCALTKVVPQAILQSSKEVQSAFLRGLFDTDGGVYNQESKNKIGFFTTSNELAKQVQIMLLNYGIVSSLYINTSRENHLYVLEFCSKESILLFDSEIGFGVSRKANELKNIIELIKNTNRRSNRDYIPNIGNKMRCIINNIRKFKKNNVRNSDSIRSFEFSRKYSKQNFTRTYVSKIIDYCDKHQIEDKNVEELRKILNSGFYFVKVKNKSSGFDYTYDFSVDNIHDYFSNGFISHNSKLIFREIERMYDKSPLLRLLCNKPSRTSDRHYVDFHNGSSITALPMGPDGSKIRGERGHVVIADEFDCLLPTTLIETTCGIQRIGDIIKSKNEVKLFTGDDNLEEYPTKYIKTPSKVDVYKVKTKYGFNFGCSEKHKVMTHTGWKFAKHLNDDDYLVMENKYKFPDKIINKENINIDKKLAWIFGILTSEGNINGKYNLDLHMADLDCVNKFTNLISGYTKNTVGVTERGEYIDKRGWKCKKSYCSYLCDLKLRDIFSELGLERETAVNKKIPWSILLSPKEIVVSYLKGLFQGDGSCFVFNERNSYGKRLGITYYTASEQLANEVHVLLSKFNIIGSLYTRISDISNTIQYNISFRGENAWNLFELLNIDKWKNCAKTAKDTRRKYKGVVWIKRDKRWRATVHRMGRQIYLGHFKNKEDAYQEVCKNKNKLFLKVDKVEKLKEKQILYDFYLPESHSFYGNGFRQHNSIDMAVFDVVIRGFSATELNPFEKHRSSVLKNRNQKTKEDFTNSGNKIILAGTAAFRGGPLYKMYNQYSKIIANKVRGNVKNYVDVLGDGDFEDDIEVDYRQYCIIKYKYQELPLDMMDIKMIHNARATMPKMYFRMEYECQFADDTAGYFKFRDIRYATSKPPNGFSVLTNGIEGKEYVIGVDPARSIDRCAISVVELGTPNKLRYCIALEKSKFSESTRIIRELTRKFKTVGICMDKGGGGLAIEELINTSEVMEDGDDVILRNDDESKRPGRRILYMIDFTTSWIEEANALLNKNIEDRVLMFPMGLLDKGHDDSDKKEKIVKEVSELKKELVAIEVTYTKTGKKHFDLQPPSITSHGDEVVRHKDRYSSLLLANFLCVRFDQLPSLDAMPDTVKIYNSFLSGDWVDNL